ncbi:11643_t:CDS:2, partial [Funneliformis caledonium]
RLNLFGNKDDDSVTQVTSESPTTPSSFPIIYSVMITPPSSVIKMTIRKNMLSDKTASKAMTVPKATASKAMVDQAANDSRELTKLIKIGQSNSSKLNSVIEHQERLEAIINKQKGQIAKIILRLKNLDTLTEVEVKDGKGKGKNKGR